MKLFCDRKMDLRVQLTLMTLKICFMGTLKRTLNRSSELENLQLDMYKCLKMKVSAPLNSYQRVLEIEHKGVP